MLRKVGAAAAIFDEQGQVLLVRHTYGRLNWELPGGGAEGVESVTTTAVREVQEETGLRIEVTRLSGIYEEEHKGGMLHFAFLCRCMDDDVQPRPASPEVSACGYWSPDALPRPISDFTVRRVHDALHTRAGQAPALPVAVAPRRWFE
jgi:8-oxo-dGTP diphosphatase